MSTASPDMIKLRTPPTRATLILLTAVSVLTLNMFLPSLPSMAADFGVSYAAISWAIAAYLFLSAGLALVLGPLADRYGRRPVLLITFSIFTLASVGAALTSSFALFLAFRMAQAVCATGSTLSRAIVRDMYPPGKGTSVLGYIAMAMAVGPMIGPLVGGLLEETLGWRSIFWLFGVMGLLCVALIWADLGETALGKGRSFSQQVEGYKEVLKSDAFWSHALVIGFSVSAFFVFLAGAPLVSAQSFDLAPSMAGLAMGSTALGFFMGSFVAGKISERADLGAMMVWGRWIALLGPAMGFLSVIAGYPNAWVIFGLLITVGIGNGISLPAANTGAMSVRPDLAGSASGLSASMATFMGAAFSALTGALLSAANGAWLYPLLIALVCLAAILSAHWAARSATS